MRFVLRSCILLALVLFPLAASSQRVQRRAQATSGGGAAPEIRDAMSDEQRTEIERGLKANIEGLKREGRLSEAVPQDVALNWPVRRANLTDFNIEGISNYVDQNPANPGATLDWNCGTRTYDISGYNHRGIDIFSWPFPWFKMDNFHVEVVAAAAGTIVQKADGNFDRNCAMGSGNPNMIFVRHADGSIAWYLHMKSGSLTSKGIGATVAQGEFLGVVGSSGSSTGPHLHFELYNAAGALQEPFQGTCNNLNAASWWAVQEPYRVSRLNALFTNSAPPGVPACPTQESPNTQAVFAPGATLYTAAYYRDQLTGQQTQYELLRPDNSLYTSWVHNSPNTYNASYWWYSIPLPTTPVGTWHLRTTYNGQTYLRAFALGAPSSSSITLSGRVLTRDGRGVTNALITLRNNASGAETTARSLRDGRYVLTSIPPGATYTLTVSQARFNFGSANRVIQPVENTTGLDLIAH